MRTIAAETSMRTVAASIVVLAGDIITSALVIWQAIQPLTQDDIWIALGLSVRVTYYHRSYRDVAAEAGRVKES